MEKTKLKNYGPKEATPISRMDEDQLKIKQQKQTEQMDSKINELASKAIEFYDLYGAEDYRYQMMVTFLDVAFQMKDAIALITSVQVATSYLSTAIEFIDDSILFEDQFNQQLLSKSYGPFARLKRKIMMRRASRNNQRRLETAINNIVNRVQMAHEITDSLRTSFEKMKQSMAKADAKRAKRDAKRAASGAAPAPGPSRALQYIDELRGGKGGDSEPAGTGSAPATDGATGDTASGGVTTAGIDDIL